MESPRSVLEPRGPAHLPPELPEDQGMARVVPTAFGSVLSRAELCAHLCLRRQLCAAVAKRPWETIYCKIKPVVSGSVFLAQHATLSEACMLPGHAEKNFQDVIQRTSPSFAKLLPAQPGTSAVLTAPVPAVRHCHSEALERLSEDRALQSAHLTCRLHFVAEHPQTSLSTGQRSVFMSLTAAGARRGSLCLHWDRKGVFTPHSC